METRLYERWSQREVRLYCDFGAIKDPLIRDQIVVGINDPKLRERLPRETDLTLEKAIKLCRITEHSKEQSKIFI